jgi:hypothetical protein
MNLIQCIKNGNIGAIKLKGTSPMKAPQLFIFALCWLAPLSAFAWSPTCPMNGTTDFNKITADAIARDKKIADDNSPFYFEVSSLAAVKNPAPYAAWALGQLNNESLLAEQLAETFDSINGQFSNNHYVSLLGLNGEICRRQVFRAADVKVLNIALAGSQLTVTLQAVLTDDSRWESITLGERFEAKYALEQDKYSKAYTVRLVQYPSFTKEVTLKTEQN